MPTRFKVNPPVTNAALNALFAQAWPQHIPANFKKLLRHSLFYVCAIHCGKLVGFVKLVSDGGVHGFVLDPTVAPAVQRRGVGRAMIDAVKQEASKRDIEWLHVDYEPRLARFYAACGFASTKAGVLRLTGT